VVFLSGLATIFWGAERVFTTAASNRNYELKKSQFFHVLLFGPMIYIWVKRWDSCLRHCATSRKVAGSIPEGVIVWAKVQALVYIQRSIILSVLLSKPTYNQSSRCRKRGDIQSVFLKGFLNKHDQRSAGPRVPVCTSQRTQPASIIKNSHDERFKVLFLSLKKRGCVGSGIARLFAPEPNSENGRP